jgi:hypothetical protein
MFSASIINENEKPKKLEKSENQKKQFVHSSNVILTRGQYKGYYAFVSEVHPATVEISFDDEEYVLARMYGDKNVGDTIITKFGYSKITNKICGMYGLNITNDQNEIEEIRMPFEYVIRVVCIKEGKLTKLASVISVNKNENGISMCNLKILDLNYNENISMQLTELSCKIRDDNTSGNIIEVAYDKLTGEDYYFVNCSPLNKKDIDYKGKCGRLSRVIEEQYMILYNKTVVLQMSNVIIKDNSVVNVVRGVYKNKVGKLICKHKSHLNVFVNAMNKLLLSHMVRGDDNVYNNKKITADDVFYMDVLLSNGNYFQVSKVLDNGDFMGLEKNNLTRMVSLQTISQSEIRNYGSGFELKEREIKIEYKNVVELVDVEVEVELEEKDDESDNNSNNGEYENDEKEAEINDEKQRESNDVVFSDSYKDIERTSMMSNTLNSVEIDYMKMVEKVLDILLYGRESINCYTIVPSVMSTIRKIKDKLEKDDNTNWKKTDEKYIMTIIVLYELVRNGQYHRMSTFNGCAKSLYDSRFFTKNDILSSTFLQGGDKNQNKIVKDLYKSGTYFEIVKMMLDNCKNVLEEWYGKVNFEMNNYVEELIAVTAPHTVKVYPRYFITVKDIVEGNYHYETAKKIMWGPDYIVLIEKWKNMLIKKSNDESNPKLKTLFNFIIENFDKAPMVLKSLEGSIDEMDCLKYKEFKRIFERVVEQLTVIYNKVVLSKEEKLTMKKDENERLIKRRREIIKCSNDETEELTDVFVGLNFNDKNVDDKKKVNVDDMLSKSFKKIRIGKSGGMKKFINKK